MVQPKELKLGNWVKDRGGKFIRIDFFEYLQSGFGCKFGMKNHIEGWGDMHDLTEYTDYAEPIPLTPEILKKAGFVLHFGGQLPDYIKLNGLQLFWYAEELTANFQQSLDVSLKYLHQLQNLYFALTGTELDFTL